jgi:hypothetical protein
MGLADLCVSAASRWDILDYRGHASGGMCLTIVLITHGLKMMCCCKSYGDTPEGLLNVLPLHS